MLSHSLEPLHYPARQIIRVAIHLVVARGCCRTPYPAPSLTTYCYTTRHITVPILHRCAVQCINGSDYRTLHPFMGRHRMTLSSVLLQGNGIRAHGSCCHMPIKCCSLASDILARDFITTAIVSGSWMLFSPFCAASSYAAPPLAAWRTLVSICLARDH